MQFGIFTVGDVTTDPTTGRTPTEHERIKAQVEIAKRADAVGLDVVAFGQHHNPPFVAVFSDDDDGLGRGADRADHPVDRDDADHDHRSGPDRRGLRDAPASHRRADGPDAGAGQHRPGLPVVRQGHPTRRRARDRALRAAPPPVARGCRQLAGPVPDAAPGLHLDPATPRRPAAVRVARLDPDPGDRRAGRVLRRRVLREPHLLAARAHEADGRPVPRAVRALRARHADQAIVGLGGQVFMRPNSQDAIREFRPYFDRAPVYGGGPTSSHSRGRRR